jgi:hypothetical protein
MSWKEFPFLRTENGLLAYELIRNTMNSHCWQRLWTDPLKESFWRDRLHHFGYTTRRGHPTES